MVRPDGLELEPVSRRERSGRLLAKSRAKPRDRQCMVRPDGLEPPTLSFVG
jgi:hypothetical protein